MDAYTPMEKYYGLVKLTRHHSSLIKNVSTIEKHVSFVKLESFLTANHYIN